MLQRAAGNAYSWWWASHIRTKQSKWLEQSLLDMEEKVGMTLKIIDDDGDSFAKRAEMYYRKRPELVSFVEDSYKEYRALAERYDHLSRELQSANRKIATVFPEEVPFDVDDDDFDDSASVGSKDSRQSKDLSEGSRSSIPKVPSSSGKNFSNHKLRRAPAYTKPAAMVTTPVSGLTKDEATVEIDKLQKEILSFQTEKEFLKTAFERGRSRFWEIENQMVEMQHRVCSLQDEFEIGILIEDNDARKLMATAALKSCQEALSKMHERHVKSEQEVRIEEKGIHRAHARFERISGGSSISEDTEEDGYGSVDSVTECLESTWKEMRDEIDAKLTVSELTNKVDFLVGKVVDLEIEVSSQAAQVGRLRSETAILLSQMLNFEEDHKKLTVESSLLAKKNAVEPANKNVDGPADKTVDGSAEEHVVGSAEENVVRSAEENVDGSAEEKAVGLAEENAVGPGEENAVGPGEDDNTITMNVKVDEFGRDLVRVKSLKRQVLEQCRGILSQFSEASSNLNQLSEKIGNVKIDDEVEQFKTVLVSDGKQEAEIIEYKDQEVDDSVTSGLKAEDMKDEDGSIHGPAKSMPEDGIFVQSGSASDFGQMMMNRQDHIEDSMSEVGESQIEGGSDDFNGSDDQPNWRQLFLNGIEDREKILLEEYTSMLRSYKEVKNKLNETERKSRDGMFEMALQIRELRIANNEKEEQIKSLRQKLRISVDRDGIRVSESPNEAEPKAMSPKVSSIKQPLYKLLLLNNDRMPRKHRSTSTLDEDFEVHRDGKAPNVLSLEEKLRAEINDLIEENMEFWLRFSTSVHQIQKFETTLRDLQVELSRLKIGKKPQEGSSKIANSVALEARPIYKHLRDIQTETKFWLEHHTLLNEELQGRYSTLNKIQDEVSRNLEGGSSRREAALTEYQAAKFQGEILNMRQESKKVGEELESCQERVRKLQAELEKTLSKLDDILGLSKPKSNVGSQQTSPSPRTSSSPRPRIPLRSFLFGTRLKKQKQSGLFSCMNPSSQTNEFGHGWTVDK